MNIWDIYKILHSWDIDKSLKLFLEYYNIQENKLKKEDFLNCTLGLWEIYMNKKEFNKAKKYYIEWFQLSNWKDFNILFNLGVLFYNLWENDRSLLFFNKAKEINSNDKKIDEFLNNNNKNNNKTHLIDVYKFKDNNWNLKLQIVFRLTLNCNQRCIFCNVVNWENNTNKNVILNNIRNDILNTLQEYKNVSKENIELVLSWWEPTLHIDFWAIVDFFLINANKVVIQTNGVMFNEQVFVDWLKKRKNENISFYISFHSHIEDFYNKITQTNQYNKAVKGIKNILTTCKEKSQINFVFNKYNINTFSDYLIFIKDNFLSINKDIVLNISSITWVNTNRDLIKYSDILDNIYDVSNYINENYIRMSWLKPWWAMCDIPFCVYSKYIDLNLEIKDKKLFVVNKLDRNNMKLDSCSSCSLNKNCPWILKVYVEKFGTSEFIAVK